MKEIFDMKSIKDMVREFEAEEKARENIIQLAREIIKESKQIIYSIHRISRDKNQPRIAAIVKSIESKKKVLEKLVRMYGVDTGISSTAMQEYSEAICFYDFINNRKIKTAKQMGISYSDYLASLSDLTGELGRYCVIKSIKKDVKSVEKAKNLIEDIFGVILMFDFRNGDLRKKSDAIKWNLKKAEEVLFDLKKNRG